MPVKIASKKPATPEVPAKSYGPALTIQMRPLASLAPYQNNPRVNDHAVADMRGLLREFGFRVPMLVRGDEIVDGHLRYKAAKAESIEIVPVIDVSDLDDAHVRALRLSMNKSAEWAEWNPVLLADEFKALTDAAIDLGFIGFDAKETDAVLKDALSLTEAAFLEGAATPPAALEAPSSAAAAPVSGVNKGADADAGLPADPAHVSITFSMSADHRKRVLAYLAHLREKHGYATSSAVLYAIVDAAATVEGFK